MTTIGNLSALRDRLYESYVSQPSGWAPEEAVRLLYRRDIRPFLPPRSAGPVVDIGCGSSQLVRCLLGDGYDAEGIDVSPEQVAPVEVTGCPPPVHGLASAVRMGVRKSVSGLVELALAAGTGALRGHIVTQNLTFAAGKPQPGGRPGPHPANAGDC